MPDFQPVHPGEILRADFIEPPNMVPIELAWAIGVDAAILEEILAGQRPVTADTARHLNRLVLDAQGRRLRVRQAQDEVLMLSLSDTKSAGRQA